MKRLITVLSYLCIGLFCTMLLYVAILALVNPRAVMGLVDVQLNNNDALSSIRAAYGGVGVFLTVLATILSITNLRYGLLFFLVFWLTYAACRILTLMLDGILGKFGSTWLKVELIFGLFTLVLYALHLYGDRKMPTGK